MRMARFRSGSGRAALRLNLRLRLALGALVLATLAVTAAGIAVFGLSRTQALATDAIAAQHRIEGYLTLSARMNDWTTAWLFAAAPPPPTPVLTALDGLERMVEADVDGARDAADRAARDRQRRVVGAIRGQFEDLAAALTRFGQRSPEAQAALAFYGAQGPDRIAGQIQMNASRRDEALREMDALRRLLHHLALAIAILAPLGLIGLHLWLIRPLVARLRGAAAGAGDLGRVGLGDDIHDELGLLFARIRQISARLDRRQQRLAAGHARLEALVAERTEALSDANRRLSHADAERRRFFADVSHELRTPLTVILGEAELGLRDPDPARRESFATVQSRALRLYRRIEDLLRIARSDSGQLDLRPETADLGEIATAALADARPLLARAGVTARVVAPAPVAAVVDPDWIRQILAGLLENAAKYAGRGASVTLAPALTAEGAVLDVADDGPGLAAPDLARIFDRFARGPEGGRSGFGVGLALARWVVEAHGGRITAESAGAGLTLRLTLPAPPPPGPGPGAGATRTIPTETEQA